MFIPLTLPPCPLAPRVYVRAMADSGASLASRLRRFDAYPKTLEDFRIKTFSGAAGGEKA